ncbi:hypothetical protein CHUAL_003792 [Chamberlinius hualienensis]
MAAPESTDMRMDESALETIILTSEEKAESKKEEGNEAYKRKQYKDALEFYNEAIELSPLQASYYGNRAACYMMLGMIPLALEDARQSIKLDETFVKGYIRESKCHLALGDIAAAERPLQRALQLEPKNKLITAELVNVRHLQNLENDIQKSFAKKDYRTAVYYLDQAIHAASACQKFRLTKAECLVHLARYQESQDIVYDIMRADPSNVNAIYVRGLSLYYQDNVDKAFTHFQQALRLEPDHVKARDAYKRAKTLKQKKEEGNEAFRTGRLAEACDLYTYALQIDPDNVFTNAKIYFNRAIVYAKLNKINQAIGDCTQAINLDDNYTKAYLKRAKCYMDTRMYEEAVRDYEKVCKIDKSRENRQLLQDAKLELKKSKRKDYYKILGIGRNATEDDIKKAYRKRALEHHPDRHSNASEDFKKEQEKKFKDLGEAYSILSDSKQRTRYDNGQDLDNMDFGHDFDPSTIFQTFGGPGQFGFNGGNSGGNFSFPFSFRFQ